MQVAPGIHRIETPFGPRVNAAYLLVGTRHSMLVDTTTRQAAEDVLVVTTHSDWDHAAGNGTIRRRSPGSLLLCHELDRAMIEDVEKMISDRYGEFREAHGYDETEESKSAIRNGTAQTWIDIALTGGETFDLGEAWRVQVLHTPGHSHGSISVYDPRSRALIVGDAVLGAAVPLADGAPAFPPTYRYLDEYTATIRSIRELNPDLLLTGHYPVYRGSEVADFLNVTSQFVDNAQEALVRALRGASEPVGLVDVANSISAELGGWPPEAAAALLFPLSAHLEPLIADGHVVAARADGENVTRYRWAG